MDSIMRVSGFGLLNEMALNDSCFYALKGQRGLLLLFLLRYYSHQLIDSLEFTVIEAKRIAASFWQGGKKTQDPTSTYPK
jgi:hypothetical protein